jgi:hypothetical protein
VCECKQLRDMCFAGSIGVEPCPDKPGFYRHLDGYTDGAPTSQLGGRDKSHHKGSGWK